jgi:D-alanine-D-alanine ligase
MKKKINVGILFGGKSAEHEVSLQSAKNIFDALDRNKYNPILIGIDKTGKWILPDQNNQLKQRFLLDADDPKRIHLSPSGGAVTLAPECAGTLSSLSGGNTSPALDVIFPILHGPFGEDGTVQGLLRLADIPFVGAGVLGSAVGMDKDVMKRLLRDGGLPVGDFITLRSHESILPFRKIKAKLGLPFFVKPANMGSSVGISKVHTQKEYTGAIEQAFQYDTKIVIEEFIQGREIECSILGNDEVKASLPGEIVPSHEFYSYEAKYIDDKGAALVIPARLPKRTIQKIQSLAVRTFQILNCEGLARVDFFLKEDGAIIINEINTMPGFTRISMYPKLWEACGISYSALIDTLIELAIQRFKKEKKLKISYF